MTEVINEKFKDITTTTIKVTLPLSMWNEWNSDCVENFNGTRYLKMKLDHDFRKQFKSVGELIIEDLEDLRGRVAELEMYINELEQKKSSGKTMTFEERRKLAENGRK